MLVIKSYEEFFVRTYLLKNYVGSTIEYRYRCNENSVNKFCIETIHNSKLLLPFFAIIELNQNIFDSGLVVHEINLKFNYVLNEYEKTFVIKDLDKTKDKSNYTFFIYNTSNSTSIHCSWVLRKPALLYFKKMILEGGTYTNEFNYKRHNTTILDLIKLKNFYPIKI